jgi:hypothetical protein
MKRFSMGDSSYRLNFDQGKKNEIQHHSEKERLKMSRTAKPRLVAKCCKMKKV